MIHNTFYIMFIIITNKGRFNLDVLIKEKVRMSSPSYVEEQKAIKDSFKDALEDNSDDEDILKLRTKTKEEQVDLRKCKTFGIFNIIQN